MTKRIKKILALCLSLCLALGAFAGCKEEEYSSISCNRVKGTSEVSGIERSENAYEGMHLYTGDNVNVLERSNLILELDMDKHLFADEKTKFEIRRASDKHGTDTKIIQTTGGTLTRIDEPLGESDSFVIETPSSTLSVRGTDFNVVVERDENGIYWSRTDVYSGEVFVNLKTTSNEENGVSHSFMAGEACLIRAGEDFSEFVIDKESDNIERRASIEHISEAGLKSLLEAKEEKGDKLKIDAEEISNLIKEKSLQNQANPNSEEKREPSEDNQENGFERESIIPVAKIKNINKLVDGEKQVVAVLVYDEEEAEEEQANEPSPNEDASLQEESSPQNRQDSSSQGKNAPQAENSPQAQEQVPQAEENAPKLNEKGQEVVETAKSTPREPSKPSEPSPSRDSSSSSSRPTPPPEPKPTPTLEGIAITTEPTKKAYFEGETFDPTGMTVTATYSDKSTKDVSQGVSYKNEPLTQNDNTITISYTEGNVTKTATVNITVEPKPPTLKTITITPPKKTEYFVGEKFDPAGMVVMAMYDGSTERELTENEYTVFPTEFNDTSITSVTITPNANPNISKDVKITVTEPKVIGINSATAPTDKAYFNGDEILASDVNMNIEFENGTKDVQATGFKDIKTGGIVPSLNVQGEPSGVDVQPIIAVYGNTVDANNTCKVTYQYANALDITINEQKPSPESNTITLKEGDTFAPIINPAKSGIDGSSIVYGIDITNDCTYYLGNKENGIQNEKINTGYVFSPVYPAIYSLTIKYKEDANGRAICEQTIQIEVHIQEKPNPTP